MKSSEIFNLNTISIHNQWMYDNLIYENHVTSRSLKRIDFEEGFFLKGFFAIKERTKYFIDEKTYNKLPIKLGTMNEELTNNEDIVIHPRNPKPFKIIPEKKFDSFHNLVNELCDFEHTQPDQWTLLKLIAIVGYVSRTFICISSNPEFGKSSIYEVLNGITDKCPVFKPRSVPGVLNKINSTGNMVFDDVLEAKKDVREILEEFNLKVAGGASVYINGAMKSVNTKNKYLCINQSITYTFNDLDCYKDEGKYFEVMFENNKAINTRFLKLKFNGVLSEKFSKDFDIQSSAKENRMLYINLAKHLLWLQDVKSANQYQREFDDEKHMIFKSPRHRQIYSDLTWVIDMYSLSQDMYDKFINLLNDDIKGYKEMVTPGWSVPKVEWIGNEQ